MKCSPEELARSKAYRVKHREEILRKLSWKWANDPEYRARRKEYKEKHKASLKPAIDAYGKKYRATTRKEYKIKLRQFIFDYLLEHPCIDCGEPNPVMLEFDHVRGEKRFAISEALGYCMETVKKEIDKCDVRCANCHRMKTFITFGQGSLLRQDQKDHIFGKGMM